MKFSIKNFQLHLTSPRSIFPMGLSAVTSSNLIRSAKLALYSAKSTASPDRLMKIQSFQTA
ncbi:hypothetical protein D3C84_1204580 [compost metagenome]